MEYRDFDSNSKSDDSTGTIEHVWIETGEMIIVPRGVEHRPVADEEAHVLLFEPVSTLNTGNVTDEFTVRDVQKI
jgi:mannose-6-phosphate isomerase-like protein (cupin superfamily)